MRLREPAILLLLTILLATGGAGAAQNGTIRVTTRLVQVDVVVRDKNGPVDNLKASDFTILDNGKPQNVAVFAVSDSRSDGQQEAAIPLPPGIATNRPDSADALPTAVTVVLFDRLNTGLQYQDYAVRQLVDYLRSIRKEDRISLYILDRELHVAQDFTSDPERLMRAAATIKPGELAGIDLRSAGDLMKELGIDAEFANAIASVSATIRATTTAEALESIALHVGGVPGRKNLVWMSTSFPFAPELEPREAEGGPLLGKEMQIDFSSEIGRAARDLNEANIAIYPVDVRGLPAPDMSAVAARRALPPLPVPDVMIRLADATGGRPFYFTNGLKEAVRSAVADGDVSYTLGFYPSESDIDGRFHKLSVKVDRKGVDIHHHSGYYATSDPVLTSSQRNAILSELVGSPLNASQLELAAKADPDTAHTGNYHVAMVIDAVDVRFDLQEGKRVGRLNLAMRLESSKTKAVQIKTIPLDLTDQQFRLALRNGLALEESVTATAGDRLRVVIQDQATGLAGSLWVPLGTKQ